MSERLPLFFDRTITHPNREQFANHEQGVALVIVTPTTGQILLLQEAHDDPAYGRHAGMWNILTETRKPGELVRATVHRALYEELGADFGDFEVVPRSYCESTEFYRETLYRFQMRCACLYYLGSKPFSSRDGEIGGYRWATLAEIEMLPTEHGAKLLIDHYANGLSFLATSRT